MSKKRNKKKENNKNLLYKYYFEIIVVLMIISGLFLFIKDFELKKFLNNILLMIFNQFKNFFENIIKFISYQVSNVRLSNSLGFIILIITFVLILFRLKRRLINNVTINKCIKCENKIYRTKTKKYVKFFGFFFQAKILAFKCIKCKKKIYIVKAK